ncbi:MAG: hypothetical protein ABSG39_14235, partial [Acidimicrobiales bacterium]
MERVLFAPRELPPLPPDVSQDPRAFATWVRRREDERTRTAPAAGGTILGLVMVVADAPAPAIVRTLECLGAQTSDRWSLTTVSPESRLQEVRAVLRSSTSRRARRRVSSVAAADGASVADL